MWNLIKKYWDIFDGTLCGIGLSFIVSWKLDKIQLIYSIIILVLVCIGLMKVVKTTIDKSLIRKQVALDKLVDSQKPMKAISMAQNPTKSGEELGEAIIETGKGVKKHMKKIKNVFVWIKEYWQQLIGLIGSIAYAVVTIYMYVFDKFGWLLQYFPSTKSWEISIKVVVGILSTLFVAFSIRNQVKWVGVGSIKTAKDYLDSLSNKTSVGLSDGAKSTIRSTLKKFRAALKSTQDAFTKAEKLVAELTNAIKDQDELIKIGLGNAQERNELGQKLVIATNELNKLKVEVDNLNAQIDKYESVL